MNQRRHAFTLVEMATSMVVLSVLLLACGSILSLADYTAGNATTRATTQLQACDVASQMVDDLNVATNFTQRSSTSVTFSVPDRLNAGSTQTVRYWTSGTSLMRQFNGGSSVPIAGNVQAFSMSYLTRLMGTASITDQSLFQWGVGLLPGYSDFTIDSTHCASEYFAPTLPNGTSSYTITRVGLTLKAAGTPNAWAIVKIVTPNASFQPTGAVLAQTTVYESALSTAYETVYVPFTGLSNLNPSQGLCVVVQYGGGGTQPAKWQYETSLTSILAGTYWCTSSNGGTSWGAASSLSTGELVVYGTVP